MNQEQVLTILREPNGSEKLMAEAEEAFAHSLSLLAQEEAAAAAFLVRLAKQKQYREGINVWLGDRALLYRLLGSEDAKMRKNIARLMGRLMIPDDVKPLIEALEHEQKRLVRPSMILALGALKTPEAIGFLRQYQIEPAADETEEKHERQEKEALEKALSGVQELPEHAFKDLPGKATLELRCGKGLEKVLAEELREAGAQVRSAHAGGTTATLSSWKQLEGARVWREALFPLARGVERNPEAIAEAAAGKMTAVLRAVYTGNPPYAFRVEIAGRPDPNAALSRAEMAKKTAQALMAGAHGRLVNAPSRYEAELRVEPQSKQPQPRQQPQLRLVNLYLKLFLPADERFAYRKGAIPASIHPANAAGLIRLAAPYLKAGATVLDPCCGSGTLLIERGLFGKEKGKPCTKLTGVDIYGKALKIAIPNVKAAHLGAKTTVRLVHNDFLEFEMPEPVDELFANLPFGNRVGSHRENIRLYQGLAERLPRWVKPGGIAVLYTMEGKLLERCLYGQQRLKIMQRYAVEAGGLEPKVLIVQIL